MAPMPGVFLPSGVESTFGSADELTVLSMSVIDLAGRIAAEHGVDAQHPAVLHRALQAARCRKWAVIQMIQQEKEIHLLMVKEKITYEEAVSRRVAPSCVGSEPLESSIDHLIRKAEESEGLLAAAAQEIRRRRGPIPLRRVRGGRQSQSSASVP